IEAGAALSKRRLEIRFEFDRPPPLPSPINPDLLQLHCAPVVNVYEAKADPLRFEAHQQEHLLRASGMDPRHMEIYSVDSVTGVRSGQAERTEYRPFVDYAHAKERGGFYRLRLAASPVDDGLDSF